MKLVYAASLLIVQGSLGILFVFKNRSIPALGQRMRTCQELGFCAAEPWVQSLIALHA